MSTIRRPRFGSLQYWPRKRAKKEIPSVNWTNYDNIKSDKNSVLGFIGYKVGMLSVSVRDETLNSMTKGKKIIIPATVIDCPPIKIFSLRFYKNNVVHKEIIISNDKILKKKVKLPKTLKKIEDEIPKEYEDIRIIVYSIVTKTKIKKTPDMIELALIANDKLAFAKSLIGKEISLKDFIDKYELVDIRGLTKGKGLVGPVKRFGISLKSHKTEKGVRRPGSLGPWHPARVTFRTPMAGQLGFFSRVQYNLKVIYAGNINETNINPGTGFKHYGKINGDYLIVMGSVQGPPKRQLLITPSFRPSKSQLKKKYHFIEVLR